MGIRGAVVSASISSAIVVGLGLAVFVQYRNDPNTLSGIGQMIAAVATAITFIWILVTQYLQYIQINGQTSALKAQENDLDLQRRSLENTTSLLSAQLYMSLINDTKTTLSRHCKSIIGLFNAVSTDLERIDTTNLSHDVVAEIVAENKSVYVFLQKHIDDPIISDIANNYVVLYLSVKDYAVKTGLDIRLFELTMANSPYEHVFVLFRRRSS